MRRLGPTIQQTINRCAHALAQMDYSRRRGELETEVQLMLKAGRTGDEVLAHLRERAIVSPSGTPLGT